jgi:tripartite-type tricarboxylate transporter receptor subunit TctC
MCDQTTSVMGQVKGGGVKALAVLAEKRSPALPEVPTIAEAGYPGAEMEIWNAVFAPKGTPPEIIKQLNAALSKALRIPRCAAGSQSSAPKHRGARPALARSALKNSRRGRGEVDKVIRDADIKPMN